MINLRSSKTKHSDDITIRLDELIGVISSSLDIVERQLNGVSVNHGKRIAVLSSLLGRDLGMSEEELKTLTVCALLHDNALTEYMLHMTGKDEKHNLQMHCALGQRNIEMLPFDTDISGIIMYHHEQIDGGGPFKKKEGEFPLAAQIIAIADRLDTCYHFDAVTPNNLNSILSDIKQNYSGKYNSEVIDSFISQLSKDMLISIHNDNIDKTAFRLIPEWFVPIESDSLIKLTKFMIKIIDYKSPYTKYHTKQVANRAWLMSEYYKYNHFMKTKIYLAAGLHDLGKLAIPDDILNKPGALTDSEFSIMKSHVSGTYELLSKVENFEEICKWASSHHEKLDGTGYCFGKNKDELDFVDRLLACVDIYQAVSEKRPYHPERSHSEVMKIMYEMADKGLIDESIVKDMDKVMAEYSLKEIPEPI